MPRYKHLLGYNPDSAPPKSPTHEHSNCQ